MHFFFNIRDSPTTWSSPRVPGCATSLCDCLVSQSGLRVHPSCHQPDVVHGWLQVAAIETTVSEIDIFACSTSNLSATGERFVNRRASVCGYDEDCVSALCDPSALMLPLYVPKVSTGFRPVLPSVYEVSMAG